MFFVPRLPWRAYLAAGGVAVLALLAFPSSRPVVSVTVMALSCVVPVTGILRYRPQRPAGWWWLTANLVFWTAGHSWEALSAYTGRFPALAVALPTTCYGLGGICAMVGLALLVRGNQADRGGMFDAALLTLSVSVLTWLLVLDPVVHDSRLDVVARTTTLGFLAVDVVVMYLVLRLLLGRSSRWPAHLLLTVGAIVLVPADVRFTIGLLDGTYVPGGSLETAWIAVSLLWSAAALHPSMREVSRPARAAPKPSRVGRLAFQGVAAALPLLVGVYHSVDHDTTVTITLGALTSFALLLVQMHGVATALHRHGELQREQQQQLEVAIEDLAAAERDRAHLLEEVIASAERERTKLAADLHDGPIQRLAALGFSLEIVKVLGEQGDLERAGETFLDAQRSLAEEIRGLRSMMGSLRPPVLDERGLAAALRDHVENFARSAGLECSTHIDSRIERLPELDTVLYRVAQEALTNVRKHAGARHVVVSLKRDPEERIALEVHDDGQGFATRPVSSLVRDGHFGLAGMKERVAMVGGELVVESRPGRGTAIRAVVPSERLAS